jgi:two-component SAPR family response regulator
MQHFRYREDFPDSIRDSIRQLLEQNQLQVKDSSPVLQVIAFGSPAVIIENEYKYIFSQRGRIRKVPEFLLYLILETRDGGYRWNEISAELWPDLDPDKAKAQFHSTLRRLRNLLGPQDYITVQDDYYQINNQYLAWCDVLAFEVLFERVAAASPEEALALQLELISLYRGEFLTGVDLGDWGIAYRAKCETRFLRTIKLAGEQLLQNDSPHAVLDIVNKGLAQDYFREDLHCLAFHVYAHLNQFDDLTAHYQEMYATFEREFGAPPLPETQRLYQQLIARQ